MSLFARINWRHHVLLVIAGTFGSVAVIPYALELQADVIGELPLSLPQIIALSAVQALVLNTLLVTGGLLAAGVVKLSIPSAWARLPLAIGAGVVATLLIVLLEFGVFLPYLPDLDQAVSEVALWKRLLGSFYGGITEEILLRLFLMSLLALLLSRFWKRPTAVLWTANVVAALVFGLLHLPAVAALTPLTAIVVVRTVSLNMIGGVIFGGLFIQTGLVSSMVAHFVADIGLLVVTPLLLDR
jgi:membrane protease YdiL (CAAX protease family)